MAEIGVIGSINMDLVVQAPRFPKPGETVNGGELMMVPGGKGANQAVAIERMGYKVALAGRVGDDAFGPQLLQNLEGKNIDVTNVAVLPGVATGVALIILDQSGQNTIVSSHGANDAMRAEEITEVIAGWESLSHLVLQMELPLDVVGSAIQAAGQRGLTVILNAAPADERARDWFSGLDTLIVNETEAELLSGVEVENIDSARSAGRALLDAGCHTVVITLGPDGALLVSEDREEHVPAIEVEVVDTTGAGDAFVGAYTARRAAGDGRLNAVRYGVCAGTLAVSVPGAQPSLPRRSEVERLFRKHFLKGSG